MVGPDGFAGDPPAAPALSLNNLWGFLTQVGFPQPQTLLTELQRLNLNLEQFAPLVTLLTEASPQIAQVAAVIQQFRPEDIQNLTAALQKLDPEDVRNLTQALQGATAMGERFRGAGG